ncbi:putative protein tyrosine phosphatase [Paenibacillus sp. OAS669]|nr:putative protein tyrosine phosphatase [Paenibacillus sp. OAS669]
MVDKINILFVYMDEELIEILTSRVSEHLDVPE